MQILNAFVPKPNKHLPIANQTPVSEQKEIDKLFQLPSQVIDLELGAKLIGGDGELAKQMLQDLKNKSLPEEQSKLTFAYEQQDWEKIQQIVHKLHGGACYCGTPRLKAACANLETYLKTKKTSLREQLYQQLYKEITAINNHSI